MRCFKPTLSNIKALIWLFSKGRLGCCSSFIAFLTSLVHVLSLFCLRCSLRIIFISFKYQKTDTYFLVTHLVLHTCGHVLKLTFKMGRTKSSPWCTFSQQYGNAIPLVKGSQLCLHSGNNSFFVWPFQWSNSLLISDKVTSTFLFVCSFSVYTSCCSVVSSLAFKLVNFSSNTVWCTHFFNLPYHPVYTMLNLFDIYYLYR